jgi:hypothetical protein
MRNRMLPATTEPKHAPAITTATNISTPLVRAEVVGKALDVHPRTVCLWAQKGIVPSVRIGGIVRFNLQEVMEAAK